jgi:acyl carrier protein
MTSDEIRSIALQKLGDIAPEADLTRLKPNMSFRDQLDIDSMDRLNFFIALSREFSVDIPERDYPQLATIDDCVEYLQKSPPAA